MMVGIPSSGLRLPYLLGRVCKRKAFSVFDFANEILAVFKHPLLGMVKERITG